MPPERHGDGERIYVVKAPLRQSGAGRFMEYAWIAPVFTGFKGSIPYPSTLN
jgi:hypothetical protein